MYSWSAFKNGELLSKYTYGIFIINSEVWRVCTRTVGQCLSTER